jgi:hypothetical protein
MSRKHKEELAYLHCSSYNELLKLEDLLGNRLAELELIGLEETDKYRVLERKMELVQNALDKEVI